MGKAAKRVSGGKAASSSGAVDAGPSAGVPSGAPLSNLHALIVQALNMSSNTSQGATFNAQSIETYYDALEKLMNYWPGILGEDAPKIGEGGSQAGMDGMTSSISCLLC